MSKYIIYSFYCMALVIANVIANRIGQIGWFSVAGNPLAYVTCFLFCDIMNEKYGEVEARKLVNTGFLVSIGYMVLLYSTYLIPAGDLQYDESFKLVFNNSYRAVLASLCAYLISNHIDVKIFSYLRRKKKGKVTRKVISTIISQFIDSSIFALVAFLGVFDLTSLVSIIISEYLIKTIINLSETPIYCLLTRKGK